MITVIVATTGTFVAFVAVNDKISPVPAAAKPIDGVLLVQLNTMIPPLTGVVKLILAVGAPLHTTWLATGSTTGGGLTVIVKLIGVPTQLTAPLVYVGVTVTVAVTGPGPGLTATKVGILPVPLAARPIDGSLLVQLYMIVPPVVGLVKLIGVELAPLHNTWLATGSIVAVGLTV